MKAFSSIATCLALVALVATSGCDTYEAPITNEADRATADDRPLNESSLGKIVENELEGTLLANGFRIKLLNVEEVEGDGGRTPRDTFTWEVSKDGATTDMTQFAVEIPDECSNPATQPAPADAGPEGSPSNGFNFNNDTADGLQGLVGEFHPNNSDKDSPRLFSIEFTEEYRVGYVRAAVQTTGNNSEVALVLGPCANVFDATVSVFEDLDGDGVKGSGEAGISGVTVGLLENG
ncbi:MAG: hypothetical protein KJO98_04075, partial [Rhodothermia bacterium]|nr:hypothetical protein [Rhodothermia bacterium]